VVRWLLQTVERPEELWLLRDAVFEVVPSQHGHERVVVLLPGSTL
jgi:hypothetical protein